MNKLITIFVGILMCSSYCFSQYTYNLSSNIGNPGGLNNDNEYPLGGGLDASWTVLLGPSQTTPTWSSVNAIPFTFNFNGTTVSQYKVSSTGVLTFSTNAVAVPGSSPAVIPDTDIPDASVMVWGIQGIGTNDNIVTKTFGSPGSQQHWIFFSSYDGGGSWSYWSIVLEESTDNIYIVDQRHGASAAPLVTAGLQINATTAVMVSGSPNLGNLAGSDPTPADNRYYEFNFLSSATCAKPFAFVPSNATINSVDLSWSGPASASSYNIEYGLSGFTQGAGTYINQTANSYSFTGLLPSQFYDVYLQTICNSNDTSLWVGPVTLSTLCIENAPYFENFDATFPSCWNQNTNDNFDWSVNSGATSSLNTGPSDDITGGGNYLYIEASVPQSTGDSAILTSPYIDISSLTSPALTFYSHMYGAAVGYLRVDVSDDGGSSYSNVFSKSGDQGDQWNLEVVNLASFSDTLIFKITAMIGDNGSGSHWFSDIAIDNFKIDEGVATDMAGVSMTTPTTIILSNGPVTVSGKLQNLGTNTVNSMDVNYSIDGGATVTESVTGLSLATGSYFDLNHGTTWSPASTGVYNIEIWATNINGSTDMNTSNDIVSGPVSVYDNVAIKRPMLESFTSSTCGPCVAGNQNIDAVTANYSDDQYSILKYQMSWPGAGDPYYSDEGGDRKTYYSVSSVPNLVLDGNSWQGNSSSLNAQLVDDAIAEPAFLNLSSNYSIVGQTVDFSVTIDPLEDFSNLTMYAAIFEYITFDNIGTNGETEFNYVMKKMVPGSTGYNISSLQDGIQVVENFSYVFQGNYILPLDATNPVNHSINHTVEDFDNLGVIVWIQDDATKEILQSTNASLVTDVNSDLSSASKIMIFPNPTNEIATLVVKGLEKSNIDVKIVNLLGEIVYQESITVSSSLYYSDINVSHLNSGIYSIVLTSKNLNSSKKIQIIK